MRPYRVVGSVEVTVQVQTQSCQNGGLGGACSKVATDPCKIGVVAFNSHRLHGSFGQAAPGFDSQKVGSGCSYLPRWPRKPLGANVLSSRSLEV